MVFARKLEEELMEATEAGFSLQTMLSRDSCDNGLVLMFQRVAKVGVEETAEGGHNQEVTDKENVH